MPGHLQEKVQHSVMEDYFCHPNRCLQSSHRECSEFWGSLLQVHRLIAGPYQFKQYKLNNTLSFLKHFYAYCQKTCKLSIFRLNSYLSLQFRECGLLRNFSKLRNPFLTDTSWLDFTELLYPQRTIPFEPELSSWEHTQIATLP